MVERVCHGQDGRAWRHHYTNQPVRAAAAVPALMHMPYDAHHIARAAQIRQQLRAAPGQVQLVRPVTRYQADFMRVGGQPEVIRDFRHFG